MRSFVYRRLPDPTRELKAQLATQLVAQLDGWRVDYGGWWMDSDYSAMSKVRNGDLRRFSLQRLVRMASAVGIEVTMLTRIVPIVPPLRGAAARSAPARSAPASPPSHVQPDPA
jgi:hypothetical protein